MPLHKHFDSGFGATAEAFKKAAEKLAPDGDVSRAFVEHLPVNFLYRHATELFLKSGVVIFHRRFKFRSEQNLTTRSLWFAPTRAGNHFILCIELHYCIPTGGNCLRLTETSCHRTPSTSWEFPLELDEWIAAIDKSDPGSTFFRLPNNER